jgi:hypothetical protein
MRKNFTLKTRGILCCCTGVEIILPVVFLALLCLPKAIVKDQVMNDTVTKPYALATDWNMASIATQTCMPGYRLLVYPDSAEAIKVVQKAAVNLICDADRSSFSDAPNPFGTSFLKTLNTCHGDAIQTLYPNFRDVLIKDSGTSGYSELDTLNKATFAALSTFCTDAFLQTGAGAGNYGGASSPTGAYTATVFEALTGSFSTKEAAMAWVAANPGHALGLIAFTSGVDGTADASSGASFNSRRSPYDRVRVVNFIPRGLSLLPAFVRHSPPTIPRFRSRRAATPFDCITSDASRLRPDVRRFERRNAPQPR